MKLDMQKTYDIEHPQHIVPQVWIRPPIQSRGEKCPYTGLGHSSFYRYFVRNPRVRQSRMGSGEKRGIRLLWLPDVFAEINRKTNEVKNGKQ